MVYAYARCKSFWLVYFFFVFCKTRCENEAKKKKKINKWISKFRTEFFSAFPRGEEENKKYRTYPKTPVHEFWVHRIHCRSTVRLLLLLFAVLSGSEHQTVCVRARVGFVFVPSPRAKSGRQSHDQINTTRSTSNAVESLLLLLLFLASFTGIVEK